MGAMQITLRKAIKCFNVRLHKQIYMAAYLIKHMRVISTVR